MAREQPYWPLIEGGTVSRLFTFADYRAGLLTGMRSLGAVQYLFVMLIFRAPTNELCLCIASEANEPFDQHPVGSHFLGLFTGDEHRNLGASNDWASMELFTARALELAREHLKVSDDVVEEIPRKPWWRFW